MSNRVLLTTLLLATFLSFSLGSLPTKVFAATTVTAVSSEPTSLEKLGKFELVFSLSRSFPTNSFLPYYPYDANDTPQKFPGRNSPYGVDGITVQATITSPSGKAISVPAFFYQDYSRTVGGNGDTILTAGSNTSWRVRFTPEETGVYTYFLSVEDASGSSRWPTNGTKSFSVTPSTRTGFLRVASDDSRFLRLSTGQSFVPISSGQHWFDAQARTRSLGTEKAFDEFGKHGVNFTRFWTQNDGYNVTVEGHFDSYKWPDDANPENRIDIATIPKGTQINQRGSYELDAVVQAAERNGVKLIFSSHEDPYWIWDVPREDLKNPRYLDYWKRNYRYRVARWGYSTSIGAWEHWNEHGHISVGTDLSNFYQTLSSYVRSIDPYAHLFTTSQGSQAYSPGFYSTKAMDIISYHDYLMSSRYSADLFGDETNFIYRAAQCLRFPGTSGCFLGDSSSWSGPQKPIYWGEFDSSGANWNEPGTPSLLFQHNVLWAGLFSLAGSSPIDWYWQSQTFIPEKLSDKKIASAFFADIDYPGSRFTHLSTSDVSLTTPKVTASNSLLRALVLRGGTPNHAYAWVQHKNSTWQKAANTSPISGSFTIPQMQTGTYSIETWNTKTGAKQTTSVVVGSDQNLTIPVNGLTTNMAIKARSTTYVPPVVVTPTPSPAIPSPSATASPTSTPSPSTPPTTLPQSCKADISGDGVVDISDYVILVQNFFSSPLRVLRSDITGDGIVDLSDYAVLVRSFFLQCTPVTTATPTTAPTSNPTATPTTNPTATPTQPPLSNSGEWTQHAYNAQKTSYSPVTLGKNWSWKWSFNGPSSTGQPISGKTTLPRNVQPVTDGTRVYIAAGTRGVFALDRLDKNNDKQADVVWQATTVGTVNSTVAYDPSTDSIFALSTQGTLYKLSASNGTILGTFNLAQASTLPLPPTINNGRVYVGMGTSAFAITTSNLTQVWKYTTETAINTPMSFSQSSNKLVLGTADLFVHAIDATTGTRSWRTKPTPNAAGTPNEYSYGWPVISDENGLVLVKMRLEWQTLWDFAPYPTTNSQLRANFTNNPRIQALFALRLDTGSVPFVVNVGHGGYGDGGYMPMGPQPVVKTLSDGNQVVYTVIRGDSRFDGRWDSLFGEVVLDNTVAGLQPGDVRWIQYGTYGWTVGGDMQTPPTDEQPNVSMAGNALFGGHWALGNALEITDRSSSFGSYTNPIRSNPLPHIVSSSNAVTYNNQSHYSSSLLPMTAGGTEYRATPYGFYIYADSVGKIYDQYWTGYATYVPSGKMVYYRSNDGALIAMETSDAAASIPSNPQVAGATTVTSKPKSDVQVTRTVKIAYNFFNGKELLLSGKFPHQGNFKVLIPKDVLPKLGVNLTSTGRNSSNKFNEGTTITAKGIIEWYQGDQVLVVTDPSQITVK